MYYEEQWVDGALCWRTSPDGAWTRYTANELAHRYESAEKRASDAQATVEALQRVRDEFERERDQLHAALMEAKAALDAEREKVKGLAQQVQDQSTANLETMRHTDDMQSRALDAERALAQLQALVRALLDTWVNGRKIHDGIPMTLRHQIDATLDATTPATMGSNILEEDIRKAMIRSKGGDGE